MKWKFTVLLASILLLASCGGKDHDEHTNISYVHDEPLTHEMEQVTVEMTYSVVDEENFEKAYGDIDLDEPSVIVVGKGTIFNQREKDEVYYTPIFKASTEEEETFENVALQLGLVESDEQMMIEPKEEKEFTIAFVIPMTTYEKINKLDVTVPVPYLEPDSVISSDALGDTTIWKFDIK